ncbi:uncharacterized protein LOC113847256 [Abrus precatorius]|uniref:Uncharacterized protein LOC113847256 n=1 Tax=Abrus precatorius TaxID=3816 RepID=A0A8B8JKT3_ABRPR|nr:uncharacterized protein LOC113847256 [Abrus precatorius]
MGSKPFIFQIDCMMSSSVFLLYCFLTFSLYSLSQHTSYSLTVMPTRKLSMSDPAIDHEHHEAQYKLQRADKAMESTPAKEDATTLEYTSNSYNPHDLVYHIDYHGVTTHPTPKHPRP